jgi:hypothetical protein
VKYTGYLLLVSAIFSLMLLGCTTLPTIGLEEIPEEDYLQDARTDESESDRVDEAEATAAEVDPAVDTAERETASSDSSPEPSSASTDDQQPLFADTPETPPVADTENTDTAVRESEDTPVPARDTGDEPASVDKQEDSVAEADSPPLSSPLSVTTDSAPADTAEETERNGEEQQSPERTPEVSPEMQDTEELLTDETVTRPLTDGGESDSTDTIAAPADSESAEVPPTDTFSGQGSTQTTGEELPDDADSDTEGSVAGDSSSSTGTVEPVTDFIWDDELSISDVNENIDITKKETPIEGDNSDQIKEESTSNISEAKTTLENKTSSTGQESDESWRIIKDFPKSSLPDNDTMTKEKILLQIKYALVFVLVIIVILISALLIYHRFQVKEKLGETEKNTDKKINSISTDWTNNSQHFLKRLYKKIVDTLCKLKKRVTR